MLELLRELLAHAEWANAVFFNAWGKSPARENEELRQRVDHVLIVQQGFCGLIRGDTQGPPSESPASFAELQARAVASHAALRELAAALQPESLTRTIHIPWFPDPPCVVTVAEAIVQLAMHTQHHRGQCMTRLRDLGGEPKNVDWIIWLWKQKPAGRWNDPAVA